MQRVDHEPMNRLDKRCILALQPARGLSANAQRIADSLHFALCNDRPISLRQRHALYAICWRFRRQLPLELQAKVAIAAADAHMAAILIRDEPAKVHAFRPAPAAGSTPVRNPLDDLFGRGAL